jgi:hypothetical protein
MWFSLREPQATDRAVTLDGKSGEADLSRRAVEGSAVSPNPKPTLAAEKSLVPQGRLNLAQDASPGLD